jgi:hypothetical protein
VPMPRMRPPDIIEDPLPVKVVPPTTPVPVEPPPEPTPVEPPPPAEPAPAEPRLPLVPGWMTAPRPLSEVIDLTDAQTQFASFFSSGATTIGSSGTVVGSNAASELNGQAGGIGGAIGRAAAAEISAAKVNVVIPASVPGGANTGQTPVPA